MCEFELSANEPLSRTMVRLNTALRRPPAVPLAELRFIEHHVNNLFLFLSEVPGSRDPAVRSEITGSIEALRELLEDLAAHPPVAYLWFTETLCEALAILGAISPSRAPLSPTEEPVAEFSSLFPKNGFDDEFLTADRLAAFERVYNRIREQALRMGLFVKSARTGQILWNTSRAWAQSIGGPAVMQLMLELVHDLYHRAPWVCTNLRKVFEDDPELSNTLAIELMAYFRSSYAMRVWMINAGRQPRRLRPPVDRKKHSLVEEARAKLRSLVHLQTNWPPTTLAALGVPPPAELVNPRFRQVAWSRVLPLRDRQQHVPAASPLHWVSLAHRAPQYIVAGRVRVEQFLGLDIHDIIEEDENEPDPFLDDEQAGRILAPLPPAPKAVVVTTPISRHRARLQRARRPPPPHAKLITLVGEDEDDDEDGEFDAYAPDGSPSMTTTATAPVAPKPPRMRMPTADEKRAAADTLQRTADVEIFSVKGLETHWRTQLSKQQELPAQREQFRRVYFQKLLAVTAVLRQTIERKLAYVLRRAELCAALVDAWNASLPQLQLATTAGYQPLDKLNEFLDAAEKHDELENKRTSRRGWYKSDLDTSMDSQVLVDVDAGVDAYVKAVRIAAGGTLPASIPPLANRKSSARENIMMIRRTHQRLQHLVSAEFWRTLFRHLQQLFELWRLPDDLFANNLPEETNYLFEISHATHIQVSRWEYSMDCSTQPPPTDELVRSDREYSKLLSATRSEGTGVYAMFTAADGMQKIEEQTLQWAAASGTFQLFEPVVSLTGAQSRDDLFPSESEAENAQRTVGVIIDLPEDSDDDEENEDDEEDESEGDGNKKDVPSLMLQAGDRVSTLLPLELDDFTPPWIGYELLAPPNEATRRRLHDFLQHCGVLVGYRSKPVAIRQVSLFHNAATDKYLVRCDYELRVPVHTGMAQAWAQSTYDRWRVNSLFRFAPSATAGDFARFQRFFGLSDDWNTAYDLWIAAESDALDEHEATMLLDKATRERFSHEPEAARQTLSNREFSPVAVDSSLCWVANWFTLRNHALFHTLSSRIWEAAQ